MLTINTNLSSLIARNSLKQTTSLLNQAIERMSSGFKINQAKDNAANYSIINNMSSQINALQVAEDNVMQGLDMISTANGVLDEINNRIQRLRDLQEQASNGTYGKQSLKAINVEVNALIDEINRMYQTTNYNNVVLFEKNEVIDDGTMAIKREVSANEDSTFKELGISNSSMEIYDIDDNLIATIDVEEEDTIGDLFTALNAEGFETKIQNGQITLSSFNGDYVSGDLADALGISKQIKTYVVSTEQSFDNEITKTFSSTETLTDTITTTTSETLTETIYITTTTSTTNTETVTETIQVETTTVKTTETITTIYTAQTETLMVTDTASIVSNASIEGFPETAGFIEPVTRRDTTTMTALSSMPLNTLPSGTYKISTTAELVRLATFASGYLVSSNDYEFVLADNINLLSISNWTPIGNDDYNFYGTFDGNGYVISNLTIDNESANRQGLFGATGEDSILINIGLENVNINASSGVGGICGESRSDITNCYVTGVIKGRSNTGGIVGIAMTYYVDFGVAKNTINNCYASCELIGLESNVGGIAGSGVGINNCYVTGSIVGATHVGGLAGGGAYINNSHVIASVTGNGMYVGGLIGDGGDISNSSFEGTVAGAGYGYGGLVGAYSGGIIDNCHVSGNVNCSAQVVGGLIGALSGADSGTTITISNCSVSGEVNGSEAVGGLIGIFVSSQTCIIENTSVLSTSTSANGVFYAVTSVNTNVNCTIQDCAYNYYYDTVGVPLYTNGTPTILNVIPIGGPTYTTATLSSTLGDLGITVNQNFILPNSNITMTSAMTVEEFINEIKKDSAVTNAELVDGVLLITTANDALDLSTGFLNSHSATQTSTESISTITTTETIMVDKEIETEIYKTIWTTTTSSETATEIIYTTTTSEQTRTETIYTTNTITLTDSTKLEELGVLSSLRVTVSVNGTKSTFELNKDSTLNDFYSVLNTKGITTSISGNNIVLTGDGDTFIDSHNIKELLELSDVTKINGNRMINTESDRFVHFTYIRGFYAPGTVTLQVGTGSDEYSKIGYDVSFKLEDLSDVRNMGLNNVNYLDQIDKILTAINERQTSFGAVQNRLESALEEISTKYNNLISSRSTLRDADIAEVSSRYIQQQILQQASATLLSTANQTPAIALQLI